MATLTWLHISDLHMDDSGVAALDLDRTAQDVGEQLIRRGLLLDFVGLTGDLAWSGKPSEYKHVDDALAKFLQRLNLGRDQLFVVPGNHDVDRNINTNEPGLRPGETDAAVSAVLIREAIPRVLNRQQAFAAFVNGFFDVESISYKLDLVGLFHVRNFQFADQSVSILCLNTAWLSTGDGDKGRLALGESQVQKALRQATGELRICLMHHPFSWLRDHEEPVIHRMLSRECAFILAGHQHTLRFAEAPFGDGALLLSAGALHLPSRMLSYNIVHVDLDSGQGSVYKRLFTGQTPDWIDHDLSPNLMSEGRLQLRREGKVWRPVSPTKSKTLITSKHAPEFGYPNLYRVASYTLPYIVLFNSWHKGVNEYRWGDVEGRAVSRAFRLPEPFQAFFEPCFQVDLKCGLVRYDWEITGSGFPNRLSFDFYQVGYMDYLMSGEHLDDPLPADPNRTLRDQYASHIDSLHDFAGLPLTNVCGVGIFLITRDKKIIVSRHSANVRVWPNVWGYSASGTMDWNEHPHPFAEVARECFEEIGYRVDPDNILLFGLGIDAKKLFFQFSFFERTARTSEEVISQAPHARDYGAEMEGIAAVPFELDSVLEWVNSRSWEPIAAAALLTLCAKEFGIDQVERAIDPDFMRRRWREEAVAEWDQRASRPGDLPVLSSRFPLHRCDEESNRYTDAVLDFLRDDVDDREVLEVGSGNGRVTERLMHRVRKLTCLDLSERMIGVNKARLGKHSDRIDYHHIFLQDYRPKYRHEIVISSQVLMHNVDDDAFRRAVEVMCSCADTIFVFEHTDVTCTTSSHTRPRSELELCAAFRGYQVVRRREYNLFDDRLVFLKLVRRAQSSVSTGNNVKGFGERPTDDEGSENGFTKIVDMTTPQSLATPVQIFLSYAREDEPSVRNLYERLLNAGFKPWMDRKDILPGERWKSGIERAIRQSEFFLACLSAHSVNKRGVLQKEIRDALDILQEKMDSDIYLIPVKLEHCEVPETLRDLQWVELFDDDGWLQLVRALQAGIKRRSEPVKLAVPLSAPSGSKARGDENSALGEKEPSEEGAE